MIENLICKHCKSLDRKKNYRLFDFDYYKKKFQVKTIMILMIRIIKIEEDVLMNAIFVYEHHLTTFNILFKMVNINKTKQKKK